MADLSMIFSFEWNEKQYDVDLGRVSANDWRFVKHQTGIKMGSFIQELQNFSDVDADVFPALLWLGKRQKGEPEPYWEDELPVFEFLAALGSGSQKAAAVSEVEAPKVSDGTSSSDET